MRFALAAFLAAHGIAHFAGFASALAAVGASLVLCALSLPQSRVGLVIDAILLVVVFVAQARGWFVVALS